jgi:hypothetical protein
MAGQAGPIMKNDSPLKSVLNSLTDEDLEFVVRLVLASGSLKELAKAYDVSYPTIRGKLDRVIERLKGILAGRPPDPMAELLADRIDKGEIAPSVARSILDLHRQLLRKGKES